jgi:hypothetical protein
MDGFTVSYTVQLCAFGRHLNLQQRQLKKCRNVCLFIFVYPVMLYVFSIYRCHTQTMYSLSSSPTDW